MADGLIIKYNLATDAGVRPIPNCAAAQPWLNQSITIVDSDPAEPDIEIEPKIGQPCRIRVRVSCVGTEVFPVNSVKVQVWVCDYTAGGVGPLSATAPPYPVPPYPDADPKSGGPTTISTAVSSGQPGRVYIPWTPNATEMRNVKADGSFHMCVAANVWGLRPVGDPRGNDGASLAKNVYGIDICGDQHHGQKNLSILPVSGPGGLAIFPLRVFAGSHGEKFTLELRPVRLERFGLAEIKALAALDFVEVVGRLNEAQIERAFQRGRPVKLHLAGYRKQELHPAEGRPGGAELQAGHEKGRRIEVAPRGKRPVEARLRTVFGRHESPGAVHVFDVVQRFASGRRRLAGGARALVVLAPEAGFTGSD
jgi:hypothetical protein